jgi:hypothetical protein
MTRQEAIAYLVSTRLPLGPFDSPEEREAQEETWASAAGEAVIDVMLDLAANPPAPEELGHLTPEDLESEVSRVLWLIGRRQPGAMLRRVASMIEHPTARATIIEVVGALGEQQGLELLAPLVERERLTEEEATRLACALGDIGGDESKALLTRLSTQPSTRLERVRHEIDVAWARLGQAS